MPTATTALTPAQESVLTGLMGRGQERPAFDPLLPVRLRELLEERMAPIAERLGVHEVVVTKHLLQQVHQCEAMAVAGERDGFAWSARSARGTVAHKAIELSVFCTDDPSPLELVDRALTRITEADEPWGPAAFIAAASEAERAELRSEANDQVAKFLECFPPLKKQWWPVLESRSRVDLCEGRVVLKGKVDLSLGRRDGERARILTVDFKSGSPFHGHVDDMRFYALLDAIRSGVPPFRVATYYLDAARWVSEDVTEDLLESAAHRVADGVARWVEITVDHRQPGLAPGPACGFCSERAGCPGARVWAEQRDEQGLDPGADLAQSAADLA